MSAKDQKKEPVRQPVRRRWIWPVLIVSLALNLLIVGLIAGRNWGRRGADHLPHLSVAGTVNEFASHLSPEKKKHANSLLRTYRQSTRTLRKDLRKARQDARDAVEGDSYDGEKLAEALKTLRTLHDGQQQSMHSLVLELLAVLSPEERKKLHRRVRTGFRGGDQRRWRPSRPRSRKHRDTRSQSGE